MPEKPAKRSRSRSPAHRPPRPGKGGFRWKDSSRRNDEGDEPGRRRDFRERSRERDRERDSYSARDSPRDHHRNSERTRDREPAPQRRGPDRLRSPRRDDRDYGNRADGKKDKKSRSTRAANSSGGNGAAAGGGGGGGEEMIVVHVNDRLGSKSAVPCLPSDTVGQFKIMVAARIGREPGQIMLRRQGERPFKDHITLEDYGISNGVQLDLEIDTGD